MNCVDMERVFKLPIRTRVFVIRAGKRPIIPPLVLLMWMNVPLQSLIVQKIQKFSALTCKGLLCVDLVQLVTLVMGFIVRILMSVRSTMVDVVLLPQFNASIQG